MPNIPDFTLKENFPIASVLQAGLQNKQLNQQQTQNDTMLFNQAMEQIGNTAESLLNRRRMMAQALAGAQMYSQTPEGQQMMAPTQTPTPGFGAPVPVGAEGPSGPTTETPSPVNLHTIATAFMGDKTSDVMKQMFEQHKLNVESNLKSKEIEQTNILQKLLAGIKGTEAGTAAEKESTDAINQLLERRAQYVGDLPTGWFSSIHNEKAKVAKEAIPLIDAELLKKGYKGVLSNAIQPATAPIVLPESGKSTSHPSGATITRL